MVYDKIIEPPFLADVWKEYDTANTTEERIPCCIHRAITREDICLIGILAIAIITIIILAIRRHKKSKTDNNLPNN
jgi:hypothetical protein